MSDEPKDSKTDTDSDPKAEAAKADETKLESAKAETAEEASTAKPKATESVRPKKPRLDEDDSPTAAHSPIAKKRDDGGESTPPPVRRPGQPPLDKTPEKNDSRRGRASGESAGVLIVTGMALLLANFALSGTVLRLDATRDERFTLSKKGTGHLLSTLKKPLKMDIFIPRGLATIESFERDLKDLLAEYVRYGDGKVSYEIIDLNSLEGEAKGKAESKAQEAGLRKQILGEAKGEAAKQATIGEGYLGMIISYGGERATLDQQDGFSARDTRGLEFMISSKIRDIRDKEDKIIHRIGYLQGHKEKGFQDFSQIFGRYFPYYKLEAIDLAKGDKEVDAGLDGLIITQPEEDIASKELRRIDQFLMRGKALAVFANNLHMKEADAGMTVTFNAHGLDKLMSGYGVDYKSELLVDAGQIWTPVLQGPGGMAIQLDAYPFVLVGDPGRSEKTVDNTFAPFFRLQQIIAPAPTEITIDQARAGGSGVTVTSRLKTTNKIYTLTGSTMNLHPEKYGNGVSSKEENRVAIVAADLEGSIKSAFPGGGEGVDGVPATAAGKARLFVMSSGAFATNMFADAGKSPFGNMGMPNMDPNMGSDEGLMRYGQVYYSTGARVSQVLIMKNTCDWISQETDLLAVGAKMFGEPTLTYYRNPAPVPAMGEKLDADTYKSKRQKWIEQVKSEQNIVQWGNIAVGPALLGIFGFLRWWMRNNRRASVKL